MTLNLLLDLDDTLIDTNLDSFLPAYFKKLAGFMANRVPPQQFVQALMRSTQIMYDSKRADRSLEQVFSDHFYPALGFEQNELADALNQFYDEVFPTLSPLTAQRPEAIELVDWAFSKGWKVSIATDPLFPPNPLSPYALQKYAAETYARQFHALYGLETVSLRYFNVFGPRQSFNSPYSGVIARFCTGMLQGEAPAIFGDGLQSRDFIAVANVAAANLLAAEAPALRVAGRVFNVAGGQSITLLDLVAELNRLTGQALTPSFAPPRTGDVRASQADIAALQQATGYRVTVPWQEGLRQTLEFYRHGGKELGTGS